MKHRICIFLITAWMLFMIAGCALFPIAIRQNSATPPMPSAAQTPLGPEETEAVSPLPSAPPADYQNGGVPVALPSPDELLVLFINVGKADAVLVLYADKAYVIDTGTKNSAPQLIRALNLYEIDALDVLLTHTDSDHVGGMAALAQNFKIETLYSAEISQNKKKGGNKIVELAQELSLNHKKLNAKDKIELAQDVYFEVLGPLVYNAEDDNDNSLILRLSINGRILLFAGDMQFAEEETLLNAGVDLKADILKVGNHGDSDATSERFAAAVAPRYAIISTDTSVKADTAGPRVRAALKDASIFLTQDFPLGVLLSVRPDGSVEVANPQLPKANANITITGIDKAAQTIGLKNEGEDVDLSGYMIVSQKNSEVFVFPKGARIEAGQTIAVSGAGGGGDYEWLSESTVWHKTKQDVGILYDRYGNELSRSQ